jgi:hypothetical protein
MKEKSKNPKILIFATVAVICVGAALGWANAAAADSFSQKNPIGAPLTAEIGKAAVKILPHRHGRLG